MNLRSLLTALLVTSLSLSLSAQDVHFSQFWASPMTLNPALAGMTPCTYRAGVNYRNQWGSIVGPSSFQTYGLSFDAGLFRGKFNGSMMGVGVNFFNDRSGDGILQNLTAMGNIAYHQQFGEGHFVSLGFQAGMVQKSVDPLKFIFGDQIDDNGVIPGSTTADILANNSFSYLDINAGFHWTSNISDNFTIYAGGAIFHLTEPVESFKSDNGNVINRRYVGHGGMKIGIQNKVVLLPSIIYQNQTEGSTVEIIAGTSVGFAVGETSNFYIGGYYREGVDVVAITGIDFSNLQLGFSYDININDLSAVSGNKGGLEISLLYFGCLQSKDKPKRVIDCPRF